MVRHDWRKAFNFVFRGRRIDFEFRFKLADDEPIIPNLNVPSKPDAVVKHPIDGLSVSASGRHYVVRSQGMRVEVDPYHRVVQIDGNLIWVETNFDGKQYGWQPDAVSFFKSDEAPLPVNWTTEEGTDGYGNFLVTLAPQGDAQPIRVVVHPKAKYVIVNGAAIKALFKSRYVLVGPERPLHPLFAEMSRHERPKVVQIDHHRSA